MNTSSTLTTSYKCAGCGHNLIFDPEQNKLVCASCGYSTDIEQYSQDELSKSEEFEQINSKSTFGQFAEGEALEFHCDNCGAVLIADKYTSATVCQYCDSPVFISSRLSDNLAPALAIPFKITAEEARELFSAWSKKRHIISNSFIKNERLKDIQGMYVPFWLYDLNGRGDINAHCTRVSSRRSGDYMIHTTRHYDVHRKVEVDYFKVPVDASEKMNDEMMDLLEPFDYSALTDFNMGYLAGFAAEKYSYTDKTLLSRASSRVSGYVQDFALSTIRGFSSRVITSSRCSAVQRNASYTLLPIYILNYDFKGETYTFMMNGQTGKIVGKPPISKFKCFLYFLLGSGASFTLLTLLSMLFL